MERVLINNTHKKMALFIIEQINGAWLAKQLKISYPTLKKRLEDEQWTVFQGNKLVEIYSFLK